MDSVTIGLGTGEGAERAKLALLRGLHGRFVARGKQNGGYAEEHKAGDEAFLVVNGLEGSWREHLAKLITQVIVTEKETEMLKRLIVEEGSRFSREEQETVLEQARASLNADGDFSDERRDKIQKVVAEYLAGDNDVSLDGLLTFRLGEYLEELRDAVERSVDDFLLEKEYEDFINFLRLFVESQPPRLELVNVLFGERGSPALLDGAGNLVKHGSLGELVAEMLEAEVNCDDLVLSSLISLAPRRVVLHGWGEEEGETGRIIRKVFAERVSACGGCHLCGRKGNGKPSEGR